tara:strand:- start:163 stop:342 length:180 start_codon:yes stop_codon:yes gene_type:complete
MAGQKRIRQKLATQLSSAPSDGLKRMNGFSPVRTTRCGSLGMIGLPGIFDGISHIIARL